MAELSRGLPLAHQRHPFLKRVLPMIDEKNCVFPEWMFRLPFQQQSVLVLALRGPDNIRKHHPMKEVQRAYRGTVLKAARYGRLLEVGEAADSFMGMAPIAQAEEWARVRKDYFNSVDELPHHFHMHLMHGAEILGYKHPDPRLRGAWGAFYLDCCDDAHVPPETEESMDLRLSDWGHKYWSE